jgi:hypothetical protein
MRKHAVLQLHRAALAADDFLSIRDKVAQRLLMGSSFGMPLLRRISCIQEYRNLKSRARLLPEIVDHGLD